MKTDRRRESGRSARPVAVRIKRDAAIVRGRALRPRRGLSFQWSRPLPENRLRFRREVKRIQANVVALIFKGLGRCVAAVKMMQSEVSPVPNPLIGGADAPPSLHAIES